MFNATEYLFKTLYFLAFTINYHFKFINTEFYIKKKPSDYGRLTKFIV